MISACSQSFKSGSSFLLSQPPPPLLSSAPGNSCFQSVPLLADRLAALLPFPHAHTRKTDAECRAKRLASSDDFTSPRFASLFHACTGGAKTGERDAGQNPGILPSLHVNLIKSSQSRDVGGKKREENAGKRSGWNAHECGERVPVNGHLICIQFPSPAAPFLSLLI